MNELINIANYFFNPVPEAHLGPRFVILGAVIALFIISIVLRIYIKKNKEDKALKNVFKKYIGQLQAVAFLLGAYLVFRYAGIPFLSARIVLYAIIGGILYVFVKALYEYKKVYPLIKEKYRLQIDQQKYMPKKRKK